MSNLTLKGVLDISSLTIVFTNHIKKRQAIGVIILQNKFNF